MAPATDLAGSIMKMAKTLAQKVVCPCHRSTPSKSGKRLPPLRCGAVQGRLGRKFCSAPTAAMCTNAAALLEPTARDVPYPLVLASQQASTPMNARHRILHFDIVGKRHACPCYHDVAGPCSKPSGACARQDVPLARSGCSCRTLPRCL